MLTNRDRAFVAGTGILHKHIGMHSTCVLAGPVFGTVFNSCPLVLSMVHEPLRQLPCFLFAQVLVISNQCGSLAVACNDVCVHAVQSGG